MVAVFNSMTFALKVTPLAVRSLSEGAVAVRRFQVTKQTVLVLFTRLFCVQHPDLKYNDDINRIINNAVIF